MIKVYQIAKEVDPTTFSGEVSVGYEVRPSEMYPAIIAHIQECLVAGAASDGVIKEQYFPRAQALPVEAWTYALIPFEEVLAETRSLRQDALELGRVWFTELLHRAVGGNGVSMGLRILKDEAFKL